MSFLFGVDRKTDTCVHLTFPLSHPLKHPLSHPLWFRTSSLSLTHPQVSLQLAHAPTRTPTLARVSRRRVREKERERAREKDGKTHTHARTRTYTRRLSRCGEWWWGFWRGGAERGRYRWSVEFSRRQAFWRFGINDCGGEGGEEERRNNWLVFIGRGAVKNLWD